MSIVAQWIGWMVMVTAAGCVLGSLAGAVNGLLERRRAVQVEIGRIIRESQMERAS